MLHPKIVAKKIALVEAKYRIKLIRHTVEECIKANEHFDKLTIKESAKKWIKCRPKETPEQFQYQPWEKDWIQNELLLCQCDFRYWFYRYFHLKNKENIVLLPDPLVAQEIFLDIISILDLLQLPILLMILKARQLGISTVVEAIIVWISLFRKDSRCVIASAEEEKSIQLSNMVWDALEHLPVWMYPVLTRDDTKIGPAFSNGSEVILQHGSQTKGIARGNTPVAAHVSEAAYYPNPVSSIESSLFRAMHENKRTFLPLESTANKKGDWWHKFWLQNRRGEDTGYNRFTCIFLPWYVGHDKYPTKDFLRNHPIPKDWQPMKETIKQAADAKLYVHTAYFLVAGRKIPLSHYLGANWEMPREQMWWYEFNYVEASRDDQSFKSFLAECAADERSCFQSKKHSVYSYELLDRVEDQVNAAKYQDYALVGDGIPDKFHLRDFWSTTGRRIDIAWISPVDGRNYNWRLIPLKSTPADEEEQLCCYIRIWQHPKAGYDYGIGVDISGGVGEDYSSIDVVRKGKTVLDPDIQVCQLYCNWICSPDMPPFCLALGIYYGQHMSPLPEALMAPETQVATGDAISHQLAVAGYGNFYYMKRYDQRKQPGSKPNRRGWVTSTWSRQLMLEAERQAVEQGWLIINSVRTLFEMQNWEADEEGEGKAKYEHADGECDDSIFSVGIAYFILHDENTIMERIKGTMKPRKPLPESSDESERVMSGVESILAHHFQEEDRRELGGNWDSGKFSEIEVYSDDDNGVY